LIYAFICNNLHNSHIIVFCDILTFLLGYFVHPVVAVFPAVLTLFFTYFYTAVTFKIPDLADNLKKYGGFIPGIRPGQATADYLDRIMTRITLAGAFFLAFIAILPTMIAGATHIEGIHFGGTALLIVVGVALDTMKQIESMVVMRHYEGFMK
jgi:preprotein translocase subunit SecY